MLENNKINMEEIDFLYFGKFVSKSKKIMDFVNGGIYKEKGEILRKSKMGYCYHIYLLKNGKLDTFEAILSEPMVYIDGLLNSGFSGIIGKKTTTSDKIMEKIKHTFENLIGKSLKYSKEIIYANT